MKTKYICEICEREYSTFVEAYRCETSKPRDFDECFEVGDLVSCGHYFSWWKGDQDWKVDLKPGDEGWKFVHQNENREYAFQPLWVIVEKRISMGHQPKHNFQYILWTPSYANSKQGVRWTSPDHMKMWNQGVAIQDHLESAKEAVSEKKYIELV